MIRKIIKIDENKCNGCGKCVIACHEGAIEIIDGKAKLVREHYCDGLGDCLPNCPENAISFEEREAPAYDEAAVKLSKAQSSGCAGSKAVDMSVRSTSKLSQWPVQIKLAAVDAPFFDGADLLIAADCTAYAFGDFHNRFINGKITLMGCPKLDAVDYSEKLAEILKNNNIKSITLTRMIVPCCGGMVRAVNSAIEKSGKNIPLKVYVISTDGKIVE